jgi:predicted phage baseplate assembly protein
MPLQAPNLDDRSYEQLKAEARSRIPRYAPEWTDFNESDPGITLVELFAWLTEMMLYRLNQVPERNYIKFLKLLDMERAPPVPAEAHLTFLAQAEGEPKSVPARSQIGAQSPETGLLVTFETDEGLDLIPWPLADVQVWDGTNFTVLTQADLTPGTAYQPFGWSSQPGSALYLGFAPPPQGKEPGLGRRWFPQQLSLRVFLPAATQAGAAQSAADMAKPPVSPAKLVWECRYAEPPQRWRPLATFKDETVGFTREGYIALEGPAKLPATVEGKVADPRLWLRCRIESGGYPGGQAPKIDFIRTNTVSAKSLATVVEEVLGESDGTPGQRFTLRYPPVYRDSLEVRIEEPGLEEFPVEVAGQKPGVWKRVDDFLASGPDDPHYVLNATAGEIRFGDGRKGGRIPVAGAGIVAAAYRHGGGAGANIAAGGIVLPLTKLVGVDSVSNLRPAVGGADEQALDDLKREAPERLRHRSRAVTAEDFTVLASRAGGVAKATAIPLAHPGFPGVEVAGAVTVVIVPQVKTQQDQNQNQQDQSQDRPPKPSGDLIRHVCNFLDDYRLLGTELYVKGPEYVEIRVEAKVAAKPGFAAGTVETAVRKALEERLDPFAWNFGQDFYPAGLYSDILGAEDQGGNRVVLQVQYLAITVNRLWAQTVSPGAGELKDAARLQAVVLKPDQLIYGGDHQITVVPGQDF